MKESAIEALTKEIRKAYYREWRVKNKDKVKEHNNNFWTKRAMRIAAGENAPSEDTQGEI